MTAAAVVLFFALLCIACIAANERTRRPQRKAPPHLGDDVRACLNGCDGVPHYRLGRR